VPKPAHTEKERGRQPKPTIRIRDFMGYRALLQVGLVRCRLPKISLLRLAARQTPASLIILIGLTCVYKFRLE